MELAKRDDVPVELTWDLSLIYPTEEAMLADAQKMKELSLSMEASYKGNLTDAATINHCLDDYQDVCPNFRPIPQLLPRTSRGEELSRKGVSPTEQRVCALTFVSYNHLSYKSYAQISPRKSARIWAKQRFFAGYSFLACKIERNIIEYTRSLFTEEST